jgi:hypothetical protein
MHTTFVHTYNQEVKINFRHNSEDVHELAVKDNSGDTVIFMTVSQMRELLKKGEKYLEAQYQVSEGLEACDT